MYVGFINVLRRWGWVCTITLVRCSIYIVICLLYRVLPAFLADMYGSHNIAVIYGIVLTAWSLAGTGGGLLFTAVYNHQITALGKSSADAYPYIINSYWILSLVVIGLVCILLVRTELKDRLLPPVKGQWFRLRFFRHILIIKRVATCPKIEVISSEDYDELWEKYLKSRNVFPEKDGVKGSENYDVTELSTLTASNK